MYRTFNMDSSCTNTSILGPIVQLKKHKNVSQVITKPDSTLEHKWMQPIVLYSIDTAIYTTISPPKLIYTLLR